MSDSSRNKKLIISYTFSITYILYYMYVAYFDHHSSYNANKRGGTSQERYHQKTIKMDMIKSYERPTILTDYA